MKKYYRIFVMAGFLMVLGFGVFRLMQFALRNWSHAVIPIAFAQTEGNLCADGVGLTGITSHQPACSAGDFSNVAGQGVGSVNNPDFWTCDANNNGSDIYSCCEQYCAQFTTEPLGGVPTPVCTQWYGPTNVSCVSSPFNGFSGGSGTSGNTPFSCSISSSQSSVDEGDSATINLSSSPAANNCTVSYGTQSSNVNVESDGTGSWTSPALYNNTDFAMTCVDPTNNSHNISCTPSSVDITVNNTAIGAINISSVDAGNNQPILSSWDISGPGGSLCGVNGCSAENWTDSSAEVDNGGSTYTLIPAQSPTAPSGYTYVLQSITDNSGNSYGTQSASQVLTPNSAIYYVLHWQKESSSGGNPNGPTLTAHVSAWQSSPATTTVQITGLASTTDLNPSHTVDLSMYWSCPSGTCGPILTDPSDYPGNDCGMNSTGVECPTFNPDDFMAIVYNHQFPGAGIYQPMLVVTQDGTQAVATSSFTITPSAPTLGITPTTLLNGVVGTSYSQTLTQTGNATSPFTWGVTAGSLPSGLVLSYTGQGTTATISGTPLAAGTSTFTVDLSNVTGSDVTQQYTVAITQQTATPAHIVLSPVNSIFTGVSGSMTPPGDSLTITNTGHSALNWTATTDQGWCHVSKASGSTGPDINPRSNHATTITVNVDAPSNVGAFPCNVSIADPNADNSPQVDAETYTVTNPNADCPSSGNVVTLNPTTITVDNTSAISVPANYSGGGFQSSDPSIVSFTGSNTAIGLRVGTAQVSGTNWNYDSGNAHATGCSLSPAILTVNAKSGSTLSATLTADPSVATTSDPVSLTAKASTTDTTDTLNYNFFWNCSYGGNDFAGAEAACGTLTTPASGACVSTDGVGEKCNGIAPSSLSKTVQTSYAATGTYTPLVIIEQASQSAAGSAGVGVDSSTPGGGCSGPDCPTGGGNTPTVTITPTTLPDGTVGTIYGQNLTAGGTAKGPFTWSQPSGTLPAGINLVPGTLPGNILSSISGLPTAIGTSTFDVEVTNGTVSTTQPYSIYIGPAGGTCDGCGGGTPPDCSIQANPGTILVGATSTVSWSCAANPSVTSCTLNGKSINPSGSTTVQPSATQVYTLSCIDNETTTPATPQVQVTVSANPGIIEVTP